MRRAVVALALNSWGTFDKRRLVHLERVTLFKEPPENNKADNKWFDSDSDVLAMSCE